MLGVPPHLHDAMHGVARPIGLPPPFVNLSHPGLQALPPLAAMAHPALGGQIPLGGMHGLGHLNLASQAMMPGLPPIVVTAVVMPNGAAVHPIQQLQQQKRLRSHATPLSVEEALHAARLEGLTLHVAPSTKTGYKGVSRGGKSSKKPFQAVRGQHSLGYYATAEEAALTYARFIAQEERQEQIAGGGELKPKRERKHSGKITRWTPEEEELLRGQVNDLGSTGHWSEIALRLGTERTAAGVDQHWQIMCGRRKRRRTLKDDQNEGGALSEVNPGEAPPGASLLALGMSSSVGSSAHSAATISTGLRPFGAEAVPPANLPPPYGSAASEALEPRAAAVGSPGDARPPWVGASRHTSATVEMDGPELDVGEASSESLAMRASSYLERGEAEASVSSEANRAEVASNNAASSLAAASAASAASAARSRVARGAAGSARRPRRQPSRPRRAGSAAPTPASPLAAPPRPPCRRRACAAAPPSAARGGCGGRRARHRAIGRAAVSARRCPAWRTTRSR
mmetsp:Transcript_73420/g.177153  ORF Transcript_73420/g.177153 Transcript_73420/m.177153 type:complete len:513 (+) Transcript_73420:49-1587(+)